MADAVTYDIQIARDTWVFALLDQIVVDVSGLTDPSIIIETLLPEAVYYVRVRARTARSVSEWYSGDDEPFYFLTGTVSSAELQAEGSRRVNIQLNPQPASSALRVTLEDLALSAPCDIRIYNLLGVEVERMRFVAGHARQSIELNIGKYATGVYVLMFAQGSHTASQSFVVER